LLLQCSGSTGATRAVDHPTVVYFITFSPNMIVLLVPSVIWTAGSCVVAD
jgi:hypothetical protein